MHDVAVAGIEAGRQPLRRGPRDDLDARRAGCHQRRHAAPDQRLLLRRRQRAQPGRLRRCNHDAQCARARRNAISRHRGQYVAHEVHVARGNEAAALRIERKLPRLLGDPRHHRREHQVERAPARVCKRLPVQPQHAAAEQRLEQIGAEGQQRVVRRRLTARELRVALDPLVLPDDRAKACGLTVGRAQRQRRGHVRAGIARQHARKRGPRARLALRAVKGVKHDQVKGLRRVRGGVRVLGCARRCGTRGRCAARGACRCRSDFFGTRESLCRKRMVARGDIGAAFDRLAVARDLGRDRVAHDRQRIGLARALQRRRRQRREHLPHGLGRAPALVPRKPRDRLAAVNAPHQCRAQVLVLEAQRVPGLVPHHARELRLRRAQREALQVHGRRIGLDGQDLGAHVRPVARQRGRRIEPRDAHLAGTARFAEGHVGPLGPGVHVQQDALAQRRRRAVEKLHAQPQRPRRPAPPHLQHQPPRPAAPRCGLHDHARLQRIGRVHLDAAADEQRLLRKRERAGAAERRGHGAWRRIARCPVR